jgi:hypothetical protein
MFIAKVRTKTYLPFIKRRYFMKNSIAFMLFCILGISALAQNPRVGLPQGMGPGGFRPDACLQRLPNEMLINEIRMRLSNTAPQVLPPTTIVRNPVQFNFKCVGTGDSYHKVVTSTFNVNTGEAKEFEIGYMAESACPEVVAQFNQKFGAGLNSARRVAFCWGNNLYQSHLMPSGEIQKLQISAAVVNCPVQAEQINSLP